MRSSPELMGSQISTASGSLNAILDLATKSSSWRFASMASCSRLKHLKAYKPSLWGERSTLNVKSSDQNDLDNMTTEDLEKKIRELDDRNSIIKESKAA
jgi:hypothetical protein